MRSLRKVESAIQGFWVFVWLPFFITVIADWILASFSAPIAGLMVVYGLFAPALLWFFVVEPILRNKR